MSPFSGYFTTVCVASLAAAFVGWFAPPTRGRLQLGECSVFVAGFTLAFIFGPHRDWLTCVSLATLFPGIYYSFSGWQNQTELPKQACAAACLGAAWFLINTTHRWDYAWIAAALGLGGPAFALWLTERTNRAVGLTLVVAATLFQLTRIPLLLAS
jgi:hypothetical protein